MIFGLACEGVTDQLALENILCGFFGNPELDAQITRLQPDLDKTDRNRLTASDGGWTILMHYLASSRFRDDVLAIRYLVIQIDTDISNEKGFDVPGLTVSDAALKIEEFVHQVSERLIAQIDSGQPGFYAAQQQKIMFCICVHSLECWLYAHHNQETPKSPVIDNCFEALKQLKPETRKSGKRYRQLSQDLLDYDNISRLTEKDASFQIFISKLKTINLEEQ